MKTFLNSSPPVSPVLPVVNLYKTYCNADKRALVRASRYMSVSLKAL